ncbi:hypothetical protein NQD34_004853 [Periophthalmus magnuspinnatus]|nr:hypothetical protein NQD34_004853 [Periophthalmus magnuspinnatus]
MEQLNPVFESVVDMFIYVIDQFNVTVHSTVQQVSEEAQRYVKASTGCLEIELPLPCFSEEPKQTLPPTHTKKETEEQKKWGLTTVKLQLQKYQTELKEESSQTPNC